LNLPEKWGKIMVDAQLNYFDMAIYSIMALSCIFAFFRGFVKEILSLIAWIGAAFITVRFSRKLRRSCNRILPSRLLPMLLLH